MRSVSTEEGSMLGFIVREVRIVTVSASQNRCEVKLVRRDRTGSVYELSRGH